ncbi:putative myosin IA [Operophtera brumata]|uniref:Putative myosin IA n=1 Tax=Operophtera brumata TaxID=104452 RepID=A0A0L7L2L6_OPEBR|nr:putative myosin IA [Operophtera brumata]
MLLAPSCKTSALQLLPSAPSAPGAPPPFTHVHNNKSVIANCTNMLAGAELPVEVESGVTTRCTLGGKKRALQLLPSAPSAPGALPPFTHAHNVITYHPASARA